MTLDFRSFLQLVNAAIATLLALPAWIFDSIFAPLRLLTIGACVCIVGGGSGCSVIDTGPRMAKEIGGTARTLATAIVAQYKPETVTAGVDGKINDPRYRCKMFYGAGTYVDITLTLEGADLGFDIKSAGSGIDIPSETRVEIARILQLQDISEDERKKMIAEAVIKLAEKAGDKLMEDEETTPITPLPSP